MKLLIATTIAALASFSVNAATIGVQAIDDNGRPIGKHEVIDLKGHTCRDAVSFIRNSMPNSIWVDLGNHKYLSSEDGSHALMICIDDGKEV